MPKDRQVIHSTPENCRKFLREILGLNRCEWTISHAIHHLGYIQLDPIDVCGRMHDLILRTRVPGYQRDGILTHAYTREPREFFEQYIPRRGILVMLPVEAYRFFLPTMKLRRASEGYGGSMSDAQKRMAARILKTIREEGPQSSSAFLDSESAMTGWGTTGTLAKTTLDKLFFHGRVLVTRRENFRRIYDLPERVLPLEILRTRPASSSQVAKWLVRERLLQRRLAALTGPMRKLIGDEVTEVRCEGAPPLFCLNEDAPLLAAAGDLQDPPASPLLLAPLDPIVYDRVVAKHLWDFDYTWEVYTPPHKRVRGYYALPVLAGTRFAGHVDPKLDRKAGVLHARGSVLRGIEVKTALRGLAGFLGAKKARLMR